MSGASLTVRKPDIWAERSPLVWSRVPEFALFWNGCSAVIPYVEHYLNNVINEVRGEIGERDPALKAELDAFIRQEANHAQYHVKFNKLLEDAGIDALKAHIDKVVEELRVQRSKRSLAFNLAYCAGFENTATFTARYLLERCDAYFEGAEPMAANLILWHVAEEFEHRAVCHDALAAVSGSYIMRIAGFAWSFWHINRSFNAAAAIIMAKYRESMSPAEIRASKRRHRQLMWRQFRYQLPRMLRLLRPGFDPARLHVPPRVVRALDFFKAQGPIAENFSMAVAKGGC